MQICISASAAGNPPMGGILASVIPGGHGFGGRRLPMALLAPPDMQICTSEIAAGAGPRVGAQNCASLCRWPADKSANWRICGHGQLRTAAHQKRRKFAQLLGMGDQRSIRSRRSQSAVLVGVNGCLIGCAAWEMGVIGCTIGSCSEPTLSRSRQRCWP